MFEIYVKFYKTEEETDVQIDDFRMLLLLGDTMSSAGEPQLSDVDVIYHQVVDNFRHRILEIVSED